MDAALVGALSAVLGSLVGGSASIATAWFTQRNQDRRELIVAEIRKREILYSEFIGECSKLAIDSLDHQLDKPESLIAAYSLQNRIRIVASDAVFDAAAQVIKHILIRYFTGPLTREQLQELALRGTDDPLRAFSEACRVELNSLRLS